MKKLSSLVIIIIMLNVNTIAQNLVPNPSFEDTISHNGYCVGFINWALNWFNPNASTTDLFTYSFGSSNCFLSSLNNPSGYQLPRTGYTYLGIFTYPGIRDYAAIKIDSILGIGCTYYIEFFVSRANFFGMASDKIGCAFANDTTGFSLDTFALPLTPAIQSQPGVLITDTLNWTKISGNYVANGTEQFLLIGNFHDDSNTYGDTVSPSMYYNAYYYIDDVKILSCDSTIVMANSSFSKNDESISIYPNPTINYVNVFNNGRNKLDFAELYDQSGRKIFRKEIISESKQNSFPIAQFKSGSYLLKLGLKNGDAHYSKIEIIH